MAQCWLNWAIPDMRTPIANALAWPARVDSGVAPLDLFRIGQLDFQAPDEERFPCLRLARQAAEAGGSAPAMLNAANEVAVAAFLDGRIRYLKSPVLSRRFWIMSLSPRSKGLMRCLPPMRKRVCWRANGLKETGDSDLTTRQDVSERVDVVRQGRAWRSAMINTLADQSVPGEG